MSELREALKWLVYLHHGVGKGGAKPSDQEWADAIEAGRAALAAHPVAEAGLRLGEREIGNLEGNIALIKKNGGVYGHIVMTEGWMDAVDDLLHDWRTLAVASEHIFVERRYPRQSAPAEPLCLTCGKPQHNFTDHAFTYRADSEASEQQGGGK